jgi:hypothetical protein
MSSTDYKQMDLGVKIGRGEIKECPHCGRRGLLQVINDITFVTHAEWASIDSEGNIAAGSDECPKLPVTPAPDTP